MSALTASLQHRRDDSTGTTSNTIKSHSTVSRTNSNTNEYDKLQLQQHADTLYEQLIQQIDTDRSNDTMKYHTNGFIILSYKHTVLKSYGIYDENNNNNNSTQIIQISTNMLNNTDQWTTINNSTDSTDDMTSRITVKLNDMIYTVSRSGGIILITQLTKS